MYHRKLICLSFIAALSLTACGKLDDPSLQPAFDPAKVKLPAKLTATAFNVDKSVFFGDLHIHTGLSTDAFVMGVRSIPDDVYTFAKGGTIEHGAGYPIQISRPLDFAAVTDHSEYMGQAKEAGLDVPTTRQPLRELLLEGSALSITRAWLESTSFIRSNGFGYGENKVDKVINKNAWQLTIDTAERHNEPGVFTAFIAYEWSAFAGEPTVHMHRNVIYRGSNVADIPYSSVDSQRPEDLWAFLDAQNKVGKAVFAIPHNANLSAGNMYANRDSEGKPLTAGYAAMRSRYEPISEIFQVKGSSETHPLLSNQDEFADFELTSLEIGGAEPELDSVKGSYMRDALRVGMELSHSEGFNPFKFGVIGASDSHNASSPVDENSYTGKLPMMDGSAGLRTDQATLLPSGINPAPRWGSGGLAGVWAEENTRASLYDALQRKETFATSGPRMKVRFFAGWHYPRDILTQADVIKQAYAMGIPMGGQLRKTPDNVAPSFVVMASKDPEGANLDRLQIIKAWLDASGVSHEKIYDVAVSDGRTPDAKTAKIPAVGNTVDVKAATYRNTIGATQLSTVWADPDFNSTAEAFYYARVLEIPTPRWSTYDAKTLGVEPMSPATIQERAVTSAIWYAPK
jgi:hypothetical protein